MQITEILNIPENVDIQYLKDNISKDQLLLVYWYIANNEHEITDHQKSILYEVLSQLDDKFLEDE
jgi:hypothetical protein